MYPIYAFGSEEQKKAWLPRMATGDVIGSLWSQRELDLGFQPQSGMITSGGGEQAGWLPGILNGTRW